MHIEAYTEKKREEKDYETPSSFYQEKMEAWSYSQLHKPLLFNEESVVKQ